jgi:predicted DNA-binding transcriptional regulator YafY
MPRSREVIRQWQVLRALSASRWGLTVEALAAGQGVSARTIRRDLLALEQAGFPLFQESDDRRVRWKVDAGALDGLDAGHTLAELCALYFGRTLLDRLAGTPFHDELPGAFDRVGHRLTPGLRQAFDRLPGVVDAKPAPGGKRTLERHRGQVSQLLEAGLQRRTVRIRYHSAASARTRDYDLHPYRIVYAEGGLYLIAYVPEYDAIRTFAVERIQRIALQDGQFSPPERVDGVFPHSLGVHSGSPERVEIEIAARMAPYVEGREWHATQKMRRLADGSLRLEMQVCIDPALRRWILGLGAEARVIAPASLADEILDELDDARAQYAASRAEMLRTCVLTSQRHLPFAELQRLTLTGEHMA